MKNRLVSVFLLTTVCNTALQEKALVIQDNPDRIQSIENVFIITTDGFRWQEIFNGADSSLINNEIYTPDKGTLKMMYWENSIEERRKKLMPFFWNVLSKKGQLFGNRFYDNKVNVSNVWSISYPGYNEIFTGTDDRFVSSNKKISNTNINVLEYLNGTETYKGKVAAFTSWDVFPYILGEERNALPVNAGYENIESVILSNTERLINKIQNETINQQESTRHDALTFETAKEYLKRTIPKSFILAWEKQMSLRIRSDMIYIFSKRTVLIK